MATQTIRQLDERTLARLRALAAKHGRSVVAEVSALDAAVKKPEANFLLALHPAMTEDAGEALPVGSRTDLPRPVDLSWCGGSAR